MSSINGGGNTGPTLFQSIRSLFGAADDQSADIRKVKGTSYIGKGTSPEGTKLADRDISHLGLGEAMQTLNEHRTIRKTQDPAELDALAQKYKSDENLDPDNRKALLEAIDTKRQTLLH